MTAVRVVLGAVGVVLIAIGLGQAVPLVAGPDAARLVLWAGGALVLHDLVAVPLAVTVGTVMWRVVPPGLRPEVRAGAVSGASLAFLALVHAGARGHRAGPTVLAVPGLVSVSAAVVAGVAVAALLHGTASGRPAEGEEDPPAQRPVFRRGQSGRRRCPRQGDDAGM